MSSTSSSGSKKSLRRLLLNVSQDFDFSKCTNLDEEFRVVKKAYLKKALRTHPDKGGDPKEFRDLQSSYEVIKDMYKKGKVKSFSDVLDNKFDDTTTESVNWKDFEDIPTPSWEFYYEAAEEPVPTYRVETAKSGRSTCRQTVKAAVKCRTVSLKKKQDEESNEIISRNDAWTKIQKGEIRIGTLFKETGTYTRWVHLRCWRIPSTVWLGLPDPSVCNDPRLFLKSLIQMDEMILCGILEMSSEDQMKVARHAMDKTHWANLRKKKRIKGERGNNKKDQIYDPTSYIASQLAKKSKKKKTSIAIHDPTKKHFYIPKPGGASDENSLKGKRFVLTGIFPEVGGGGGLSLGKGKVKKMIESFGGVVTGSVSGKTDYLVVGKNPGFSKVSKARVKKKCRLISLKDLADGLHGGCIEDLEQEEKAPMLIRNFSSGYRGNSLARQASHELLAIASGTSPAMIENSKKKKKKKKMMMIENVNENKNTGKTTSTTVARNKRQRAVMTESKRANKKKQKTATNDLFQARLRLHNFDNDRLDLCNGKQKLQKKHYVALLSNLLVSKDNHEKVLSKIRRAKRSVLQDMFWTELERAKIYKGAQVLSTTPAGTYEGKVVKFVDARGKAKSRDSKSVKTYTVHYEDGTDDDFTRLQIRRVITFKIDSLSF